MGDTRQNLKEFKNNQIKTLCVAELKGYPYMYGWNDIELQLENI